MAERGTLEREGRPLRLMAKIKKEVAEEKSPTDARQHQRIRRMNPPTLRCHLFINCTSLIVTEEGTLELINRVSN